MTLFWARGQAQVILDSGDWRITKRDLDGDKTRYGIWLEDKHGARYEILISEVSERPRWSTSGGILQCT
jgi:hypothetical protein